MSSDSPVAVLFDTSGNPIETVERNGHFHLSAATIQDVISSTLNSSSAIIAAGGSFTGTRESTLGVAGLQINVKTDQPVRVSVQQGDDSSWDVIDEYDLLPGLGDGRTTQATSEYFESS
jgi:hypothetical protein